MTQYVYTPLGDFDQLVDVLDPEDARLPDGSYGDPTVVASDVPAVINKLTYTSTTETQKPQLVVPEVGHEVIVNYSSLPVDSDGDTLVRSRMLVKFRKRIFTIMRIVDPDEKRVELHLLCIERDDGD